MRDAFVASTGACEPMAITGSLPCIHDLQQARARSLRKRSQTRWLCDQRMWRHSTVYETFPAPCHGRAEPT